MRADSGALPAASSAEGTEGSLTGDPRETLLEARFPYKELSLIAQADRRAVDPAYAAHRWWARRPPGVVRGLLLAASLPASTSATEFWAAFSSPEQHLRGLRAHDPFLGGGAVLLEAARLGAVPSGSDVDPLAVEIVQHELDRLDEAAIADSSKKLMAAIRAECGALYSTTQKGWTPLHYFYLHEVSCPKCKKTSALYRDLVIARDSKQAGAVVRDAGVIVFCPLCFSVHALDRDDRKVFDCCERWKLTKSTFSGARFHCPHCSHSATHRDLKTGLAPRRLLAIEETAPGKKRRIRTARKVDEELLNEAVSFVERHAKNLDLPKTRLSPNRRDQRPISFGITYAKELFLPRQQAVFGFAFHTLRTMALAAPVRRALRLALSNALATNNALCGYATDYGRLAPLFSVRSYSIPALAVELNPLHPTAGRGTLDRALERVVRSTSDEARRHGWDAKKSRVVPLAMRFKRAAAVGDVRCESAAEAPLRRKPDIDLCIFDPPYFDFICYSELSEFYRAWLQKGKRLGGTPLLPDRSDPAGSFGKTLGRCLSRVLTRFKTHRPLAFTYHSAQPPAWEAIGIALDHAELRVTALWPVLNDSHMGHHTDDGNCEWDLVVVCRRANECVASELSASMTTWESAVHPRKISAADKRSMELALTMASARFGRLVARSRS